MNLFKKIFMSFKDMRNYFFENHKLFAIFVSLINFLLFLVLNKNITYQFGSFFVGNINLIFYFLIYLKLSYAGFSLALLLFNRVKRKYPSLVNIDFLLSCLSYSVLSMVLLNFVEISSFWILGPLAFLIIFIPSFFYGLIYGILIEKLGQQYHKTLFYLLIGSALAVIIYNYLFAYIPFIIIYFILFFILQFLLFSERSPRYKAWELAFVLTAFIFLLGRDNFGQVYIKPPLFSGYEHEFSIMGPNGILDVGRVGRSDKILMLSDKQSPSNIAVKDDIENVEEHVKIPYLFRTYKKSLIIGVGGGQDLVAGLYYGTGDITAVEIDKQRVDLMKKEFRLYSNNLFFDERIKIIIDSARAFLKRNTEKFDLITIQRPWTHQAVDTFLYDTSGELFTEEALDSYLNALREDGVLYYGLPFSFKNRDTILLPLKQRLNLIKDNMLIFYPNKRNRFMAILISKQYDLMNFYHSYKNRFEFVYYPSIEAHEGKNELLSYLFSANGSNDRRTDKNFYGALNYGRLNRNTALIILSLFSLFLYSKFKSGNTAYPAYFCLGIGYEIIAAFFVIWLSFFVLNFIKLLPVVLIIYFLFGSIGYLHSENMNKKTVFGICMLLTAIFLFLRYNNIFFTGQRLGTNNLILICGIFSLVSYLITFPFGYLVKRGKNINTALSIDYLGSLLSLFVIWALPNLDYLLLIAIFIYTLIGLSLFYLPPENHDTSSETARG
jgi:hypothetical protein